MARRWRNWAYESAALDLALRQAGAAAARGARARAAAADVRQLARARRPAVGRHDRPPPRALPDRRLQARRRVRLDAGDHRGAGRHRRGADGRLQGPLRARGRGRGGAGRAVRRGARGVPGRDLRGPARAAGDRRALDAVRDRVSFDAPVTRVAGHHDADRQRQAVADRRPAAAVRDLRALRRRRACDVRRRDGRARHRARGQIQLLASLFHPDAPNDVAPSPFNLPEPPPGLPTQPAGAGDPPAGVR